MTAPPDFESVAAELDSRVNALRIIRPLPEQVRGVFCDYLESAYAAGAAAEREEIRTMLCDFINNLTAHRCPTYESCISCEAVRKLELVEDAIRARSATTKPEGK